MQFQSWNEMFDYITNGNDLYNPALEIYIFVYNDANALCTYTIDTKKATELRNKAHSDKNHWSAYLSLGGNILENVDYDVYKYANDENKRKLYLQPSYAFCQKFWNNDAWVNTNDYEESW